VELGRIDIITEFLMLSTYLCLPCEGHLDAVFHVFAYIALHHNSRVVFDATYRFVDMCAFIKTDWKSMYGDFKEMIPPDDPGPRGKEVDLYLLVYKAFNNWLCDIFEYGTNCVVLQASTNCGIKCVWS
jgi:hypothetical protein